MAIHLFDTLSRSIKPLTPSKGDTYRFYCCGPTVYGPAHIGNFRTFLIQDVLRRSLEMSGLQTLHVRNLTDVDDKTIRRSQAERITLKDFTEKWTQKFHQDCQTLNMLPPHVEPKAASHISQMIEMIQTLLDHNHAYVGGDGSVYFKVSSFKEYGKLAHLDRDHLRTQSTTSSGSANLADEYERDSVADFALWKAYKPEDGENSWDSPWGPGRPGWHIECSAMSKEYLGETFDLHGGGIDLCFPHHENEIAQSEGCTHKPFSLHWFHSAHLLVEGEKMSKSLGNLFIVEDIQNKGFTANTLRYLLISGHYKQPFNFTMEGLHAAESALKKIDKFAAHLLEKAGLETSHNAFESIAFDKSENNWASFKSAWDALADDLNTPAALGALFTAFKSLENKELSKDEALQELKGLRKMLFCLGLTTLKDTTVVKSAPEEILSLAQQRWDAKKARDFALADQLRLQIEEKGWKVLDHKEGFDVEPLR